MNNKKKIIAVANDFADFRGEGILARSFIEYYYKNDFICIFTPYGEYTFNKKKFKKNFSEKKIINHSFYYKYITPLWCIILIWYFHIRGFKTIYLNFLPLWNFFLFFLLPKKTILGPITGSLKLPKDFGLNYYIRKNIFPFFYKISFFFLKKKNAIIFARDFFYDLLPSSIKKKSIFNFQVFSYFTINKLEHFNINKKDIDLFVYYRKHENKNIDDLKIILKKIITNNNINVHICGNHLNILGVINHGVLNKKQIIKLLKKTKFALSTADNLLSYFVLDAINCGAKILYLSKKSYNLKINGLFIFAQGDCKYIFSSKIHSKNYNIFQKKKIISFQRSFLKSAQYKK